MVTGKMFLGSLSCARLSTMMTLLPTPVSPVKSTLFSTSIRISSRNEKRTVSSVGTSISKYGFFSSYTNSGTLLSHLVMWKSAPWSKK